MGDVLEMGKVVFEGQGDPRLPIRTAKIGGQTPIGRNLIEMPKREPTPQEQSLELFRNTLPEVENFVVLVHTKSGELKVIPCLDSDLSLWGFVDAFKRQSDTVMLARLSPSGPEATIA